MPQASTSHVNYQPKVKAPPFCPTPLNTLYTTYQAEDPENVLRYGQWFFNKYLKGTISEIKYPYDLDKLYNSTNLVEITEIILGMYMDYEWPMT